VDNALPGATENYTSGGSTLMELASAMQKAQHPGQRALRLNQKTRNYNLLFPAFLTFAQRALAAAEIAALPAALIFLLGFCAGVADAGVPLIFAHLAR
jgi:hypothetical protein